MEASNNNSQAEDQIDIIELLSKVLNRKKFILKSIVVFGMIGLLVAVFTPNQYTASSLFTPNYGGESSGGSGLKGLASLAGINLSSSMGSTKEISPLLYGKILESTTFKKQLLEAPLKNLGTVTTLRAYFENNTSSSVLSRMKAYTIGLPGKIIRVFKEEPKVVIPETIIGITTVSKKDMKFYKIIGEILTISINDLDGFIKLTAKSEDPQVAAQVAKHGELILQHQIIEIKTKSSLELLSYLEEQYADKKAILNKAQDRLSNFKDRNLNISRSTFSNVQTRLQAELQVASSVFENVVTQLEQVKLQVTKDTPVFSIVKPVVLPNKKSEPKRSVIVFIWLFLGAVLSICFVLVKASIQNILKELNSKSNN